MPERLLQRSRGTRWLLRLLPISTAITVAALALSGYEISHRGDQADTTQLRICRVANGDRMVLRNLMLLAQKNSRLTLKQHPVQLARAQAFYKQALALIVPVDCKNL